jgi:predicted RND superfamily exporter protein
LIIAVIVLSVFFGFHVPDLKMEDDESTWFPKHDPVLEVYQEFKDNFTGEFVVVGYETGEPFSQSELSYLNYLTEKLEQLPYIEEVISLTSVEDIVGTEEGMEITSLVENKNDYNINKDYVTQRIAINPFINGNLLSQDKRVLGIVILTDLPTEHEKPLTLMSEELYNNIHKILSEEQEKTGRQFYLGGDIVTDNEIAEIMNRDMNKFFPISLLIVGIVLFFIFKNFFCILFPLVTVFLGLVWTLGLKTLFNSPITPVSTTLYALITVIGVADSIHLISHYRLELPTLKNKKEALMETYKRAGKPCLFTSLTTALGFTSLSISQIPSIRELGLFAAFGIMSVFLLSMIIVPIGLQITKLPNNKNRNTVKEKSMFKSIAEINMRYPGIILILGVFIVIITGLGVPHIQVEGSMLEYLKQNTRLRRDAEFFDNTLSGISSSELIIRGEDDDFKTPEVLRKIEQLQIEIINHPKVSISYSIVDYVKFINRALNNGLQAYHRIPDTKEAIAQSLLLYEMSGGTEIENYATIDYDMVRISMRTRKMNEKERKDLIQKIQSYTDKNFPQFSTEITGLDHLVRNVTDRITLTQVYSLSLAFTVILVLMLLLFGLRGGSVSILPNIFPIVFVLGLMGYARFYLNIATAIIASIAIGIVVDDTIHYFSHFKHEYETTGDRNKAMMISLNNVGRALFYTSLTLVLGFTVFLFSDTSILMDFGLLSIIAIITALLGDLFIGPVLLTKLNVFKSNKMNHL